jgi:hypothetical protein
MSSPKTEFKKLPIPSRYGTVINDVYYVIVNGKSEIMEIFRGLDADVQDDIKDLICRMATVHEFRSPKVKYNLTGYDYGEIRPMQHRFFFFQKCGNNIIFFEYRLKKANSLKSKVYQEINKNKETYETAFEQFIRGN